MVIESLVRAFAMALERGMPGEVAALMCEEEAEVFLERVTPWDEPMPVEEPLDLTVDSVHVFGGRAVARFTRRGRSGRVYCRRENGRWTVCDRVEDDFTAEELDESLADRDVALYRTPIGRLSDEELGELLRQRVCLDVLVEKAVDRIEWQVRYGSPSGLLATTFAVAPEHGDVVVLDRARFTAEMVGRSDWPDDYKAVAAAFLRSHPRHDPT